MKKEKKEKKEKENGKRGTLASLFLQEAKEKAIPIEIPSLGIILEGNDARKTTKSASVFQS